MKSKTTDMNEIFHVLRDLCEMVCAVTIICFIGKALLTEKEKTVEYGELTIDQLLEQ